MILGRLIGRAITADELETVPAPERIVEVTYSSRELTAICPVTKQPDIYALKISYVPMGGVSLESKSLKHYLWGFHDRGLYAEQLADQISADLGRILRTEVVVEVEQNVRGGLQLKVIAHDGCERNE